jgi:hypothetical protein
MTICGILLAIRILNKIWELFLLRGCGRGLIDPKSQQFCRRKKSTFYGTSNQGILIGNLVRDPTPLGVFEAPLSNKLLTGRRKVKTSLMDHYILDPSVSFSTVVLQGLNMGIPRSCIENQYFTMFQIPKEMIPNKCIYTSYNCESKYK